MAGTAFHCPKITTRALMSPTYDKGDTGTWIEDTGFVVRLLSDDDDGSRHQIHSAAQKRTDAADCTQYRPGNAYPAGARRSRTHSRNVRVERPGRARTLDTSRSARSRGRRFRAVSSQDVFLRRAGKNGKPI